MSVSTDGTAAQASLWMVDRAYLVAGRRARCLSRSAGSSVKLSVTAASWNAQVPACSRSAEVGCRSGPAAEPGSYTNDPRYNVTLDDETTIGRCAAPSGRIRVISGSLTSSPVRLWTLATHMLTAGPTSLLIHALAVSLFEFEPLHSNGQ